MMLARCASTVLMLMPRSSAICLFRRPATMRSSTCASRLGSLGSRASRPAGLLVVGEVWAGMVEHAFAQPYQFGLVKGFLDEVQRAFLHRVHGHGHVAMAGDEDDGQRRFA